MIRLSLRTAIAFGFFVTSMAVGGALVACSGTSAGTSTTADQNETSCSQNDLQVLFTPMYTAFDGMHTFQVPAVVNGVSGSAVKWFVSDGTTAKLEPDDSTGGVLVTALKAGSVNVIATAGTLCGQSTLTITSATPDDWNTGNARYNDGVVLKFGGPHGPDSGSGGEDAGDSQQAACTNCHGPTANGAFKDVAHTPEQTGGFSDQDLMGIFRNGTVPSGGYFDGNIVPYDRWQQFHNWDMTDDEAKGIVVYLRSLTPTAQDGQSNFGGHYDGGHGGGNGGGGGDNGGGNGGGADSGAGDTADAGASNSDN